MADGDTPQLNPQAQSSLPGAAQQAADITQAPPAADVLGPAAYGDKGWQQYQDLQRAGQQAPQPPVPTPVPAALPGDPNASGLNYLLGGGGAAAPSPFVNLLGGPGTAEKMQSQVLQQQQQAVQLQQRRQQLAANGFAFLDSLRKQNVPLQLRAPMIQQWAAQQGVPIDPIQAAYIAQWGNDPNKYESHLLEQIRGGGPAAQDAAQKWGELFSGDYNRMLSASDAARTDKANADAAVAKAELAQRQAKLGPIAKTPLEMAQRTAQNEGKQIGTPEYDNRVAELSAQYKSRGEFAEAEAGGSKSEVLNNRADAVKQLKDENIIPKDVQDYGPYISKINERAALIAANKKTPPMTVQRAREQIASAQDVGNDLMSMLNDPKFDDATKSLGPSASTTIGGVTLQPPSALLPDTGGLPSYSRLWSNYFVYGGKGNTDEENRLMQAIGYFQGTGFQGFLNGIRNEKIIRDIRAHLPSPLSSKDENINRIKYLNQRYSDILGEFAKGGQPVGAQAGAPMSAHQGEIARPATPEEAAALPPGTKFYKPDGKVYVR